MPQIITRTFSDGPNQGISLGNTFLSGSAEGNIYRTMAWGANWTWVRMGILCGIGELPSQSYNRYMGMAMGFSSGSNTYNTLGSNRTCVGVGWGKMSERVNSGYPLDSMIYVNDAVSGSYFYAPDWEYSGYTSGTLDGGTPARYTANTPVIPNNGDSNKRRNILIFEASQSGAGTYNTRMAMWLQANLVTKNANRDFTSADLISAITTFSSSNGTALDLQGPGGTFSSISHATKSLDTVFIDWSGGGIPLEIYDWYIYKLA